MISEGVLKENIEKVIEPQIRETFFGSLEGELSSKVYEEIAKVHNIEVKEVFKNLGLKKLSDSMAQLDSSGLAETHDQCSQRLIGWLQSFVSQHSFTEDVMNVCVITHGNVIRNIVHYLDPSLHVTRNIANSSVTILACENEASIKIEKFD